MEALKVRAIVVKGQLVGPSSAELEEPADAQVLEVEVTLHVPEPSRGAKDGLPTFLRSPPPGPRSKGSADKPSPGAPSSWSGALTRSYAAA